MPALKELSNSNSRITRFNFNNNRATTPDAAISHTLLSYKFNPLSQGKRAQSNFGPEPRHSYQNAGNPFWGTSKIKRRISTAGTSKRFPKDFFRPEQKENIVKKQPILMLKWGTGVKQNSRVAVLEPRKKQYSLNIELQMTQNGSMNTPKFNEPPNETQNQFLISRPVKIVSPFPQIRELKIDSIDENPKNFRPNFVKKVKKGEFLKLKLQSNRSASRIKQNIMDFPRLCSIQSQQ